ncbi:Hypothetical protein CAP_6201 [Chondromyces apiculatus DSM 436]|uniref:Uncharacterized protein n=2 Tax=Chondromyces apiculatus TaxID=51 RepID=A0A017T299_9BACT|nr:Hypothetical protein CAP_6201 [Chondromyces apiculatus DSM 436]
MSAGVLLLSMAGSVALAAIGKEEAPVRASEGSALAPPAVKIAEEARPRASEEGLLGVVLARASVDVVAPASGKLSAVDVRLGDKVSAGGRVALLDLPSSRLELTVADASAREVEVELDRARVQLAEAEEKLARKQSLRAESLASGEDLMTATYQVKLARVQVEAMEARLKQHRGKVGMLQHANAEAELRASFEGIVAARYVDPGARVEAGQPIMRLIAASERFVRFAVPEDKVSEIGVGLPVRVLAGRLELMGRVEKISPEIDPASRMVIVEAGLEQVASALDGVLSGEIARVLLPEPSQK